jgi:hypothetical protein
MPDEGVQRAQVTLRRHVQIYDLNENEELDAVGSPVLAARSVLLQHFAASGPNTSHAMAALRPPPAAGSRHWREPSLRFCQDWRQRNEF